MKRKKQIWIIIMLTIYGMSCVSTAKFSSGTEAFKRKHYFIAVDMLKSEIEKPGSKVSHLKKHF
ncbi:MAG: hypothetical protein IPH57_03410 [Saprospiraceae bacterium]|nr:hypothetical protein [Saprospiraceae bacterium]